MTSVRCENPTRILFRKLLRRPLNAAALLVVGLFLALAAASEVYGIFCRATDRVPVYAVEHPEHRLEGPSRQFWCGTDYAGRDVLLRALAGSATAVKVGVVAGVISMAIGVLLGALAGYFGSWVDDLVVFFYSTFAAMPTLLFILAFALLVSKGFLAPGMAAWVRRAGVYAGTDPGMLAIYVAIGLTGWVTLCRVVRAETMKIRSMPYIAAAEVAGETSWHIIRKHVLPNVFHLVIVYFTLRFAYAIMTEVIVSFLGLGVQSVPSWGTMISDGQDRLWRGFYHEVAAATILMFLLVLALNILGDALRDAFDVRRNGE